MLIVLLVFSRLKSDRWNGTKLLWFLLIYGVARAATDFLRGDTEGPLYLGLLSLTQLLSVAAAAAGLILLLAQCARKSIEGRGESSFAQSRGKKTGPVPPETEEPLSRLSRCPSEWLNC